MLVRLEQQDHENREREKKKRRKKIQSKIRKASSLPRIKNTKGEYD